MKSCTAVAPSSTANLGPGYDVFGLALDPLKDKVQIVKGPGRSRKIEIKMLGEASESVPTEAVSNSAGLVVKRMAEVFDIEDDLRLTVVKGVPVGSGMGSSGASAAAAAMAFNRLFDLGMKKSDLVRFAVEGELASAGAKHYDNVSPSLLGGFVIVRTSPELRFIRVSPPRDLVLVVAFPMMDVPRRKTEFARGVLPEQVSLKSVVHNMSNASMIVAGMFLKDVAMISQGVNDVIVEPARKHLIPGYEAVRRRAIDAGALAVTISGAGPSMVSFLKTGKNGKRIAQAMAEGFKEAKLESRVFICRPSQGARVLV
ncbi:MAG: homoserine kinase [Desulfobacterales bacterium]|nr:homoserine kinase [Desulfobacterales bacterium]